MKKAYSFTLLLFLSVISLKAQLAPDFTITTTHNETVSLYADYLDQGKTVVIDIFFVDCPPCNTIAPLLEPLYQEWGGGENDVEFFSLSNKSWDSNISVLGFENQHGLSFAGAGMDGGALAAVDPYTAGTFGPFFGTPTFVVIAPDSTVQFNVRGNNNAHTIEELDAAITATGAEKPQGSDARFYGAIDYRLGGAMANVTMKIYSDTTLPPNINDLYTTVLTDTYGEFVADLPLNSLYYIEPSKAGGFGNGVSTFDISLIRRHLLQYQLLDEDVFQHASDVNGNGATSTFDIVTIRKLLLNLIDEWPNGVPSWKFIPNTSPFILDHQDLGPYSFTAYKVGDVDGSANENQITGSEDRSVLELVSKFETNSDQSFTCHIYTNQIQDLIGLQLTLESELFKAYDFSIKSSSLHDFSDGNYNDQKSVDGKLAIAWDAFPAQKVSANDPILSIEFEGQLNDLSSQINITSSLIEAIGYDGNDRPMRLNLTNQLPSLTNNKVLLFPSITSDKITIQIESEFSGHSYFEVFNIDGKQQDITEQQLTFPSGKTIIQRSVSHLSAGLYYIRWVTGNQEVTTMSFIKE